MDNTIEKERAFYDKGERYNGIGEEVAKDFRLALFPVFQKWEKMCYARELQYIATMESMDISLEILLDWGYDKVIPKEIKEENKNE